jgi:tetratricopeptide (TPR) repeat protein
MNFNEQVYAQTIKALESAIDHDPNYATGLAMLSTLILDGVALGFPTVGDPLQRAKQLATKAVSINPNCQYGQIATAWCAIFDKNKSLTIESLEKTVKINPYNVSIKGTAGFGMVCVGEYDKGLEWLEQSIQLNPHCPWWFYLGFCLAYYKKGQMAKARDFAIKMEEPGVFLSLFMKILTYSNDDLPVELISEFQHKFPLISRDLSTHLSSFIVDGDLVASLVKDYWVLASPQAIPSKVQA